MSTTSSLIGFESREERLWFDAMEYAHSLYEDALEAIRANGDLFSATTAKKALEGAQAERRRRNV